MPFNTYTFLLFFTIVLAVYHSLKTWRSRKLFLLAASYLFYAAWNPCFVLLLLASTVCDWIVARKIFEATGKRSKQGLVTLSLVLNLGLLGYFKYGAFFLENVVRLLKTVGIAFQPAPFDIILPVGISFYTFQTLSYTLDVYRGTIKPARSFSNYALYVSFFPQLVAGPIVRANDFLPQCRTPRKVTMNQLGWGFSLITTGLFMKIILADTLFSAVVDPVYATPGQFGAIATWTAIFAFSSQIFCDFSGYSTCAIGVALCLGFALPDNFRSPYAAVGFRDFWQRWHISLSSWLRDYLYISLGGSRGTTYRTYLNIMLTMLIGGLWHGASWMFVIWGGLHGLYLVAERFLKKYLPGDFRPGRLTRAALSFQTYVVVSLTWVFFRAENLSGALKLFHNLGDFGQKIGGGLAFPEIRFALIVALLLAIWHIINRSGSLESLFSKMPPAVQAMLLFAQLLTIYLFASGDDRAFIYFQF